MTTYGEDFSTTILTTVKAEQELDFITKGLKLTGLISFKNWSKSYFTRTIEPYYYMAKPGSYDPYDSEAANYTLERVGTSGKDFITQSDPEKSADRTFQFMQPWSGHAISKASTTYQRCYSTYNVNTASIHCQPVIREYPAVSPMLMTSVTCSRLILVITERNVWLPVTASRCSLPLQQAGSSAMKNSSNQ